MGTNIHEIYRVGNRYIITNEPSKHDAKMAGMVWKPTTQKSLLVALGFTPEFTCRTMGGIYHLDGIINARKYFGRSKMAKLMRIADGIEPELKRLRRRLNAADKRRVGIK